MSAGATLRFAQLAVEIARGILCYVNVITQDWDSYIWLQMVRSLILCVCVCVRACVCECVCVPAHTYVCEDNSSLCKLDTWTLYLLAQVDPENLCHTATKLVSAKNGQREGSACGTTVGCKLVEVQRLFPGK